MPKQKQRKAKPSAPLETTDATLLISTALDKVHMKQTTTFVHTDGTSFDSEYEAYYYAIRKTVHDHIEDLLPQEKYPRGLNTFIVSNMLMENITSIEAILGAAIDAIGSLPDKPTTQPESKADREWKNLK